MSRRRAWVHQVLLGAGLLAAVLYTAMILFVGLLWEDYSTASQTISELSAIGAPTRSLWIVLGSVYTVLMIAFGWGVWQAAPPSRALRVVGALLMVHGFFGWFWPPMHQREVLAAGGATMTDTLHIAWMIVTGIFFVLETSVAAAALRGRFRLFSLAMIVIALAGGAVTSTYASRVDANLPTPWAGVWERVSAAAYMVWIAGLAMVLRGRVNASR